MPARATATPAATRVPSVAPEGATRGAPGPTTGSSHRSTAPPSSPPARTRNPRAHMGPAITGRGARGLPQEGEREGPDDVDGREPGAEETEHPQAPRPLEVDVGEDPLLADEPHERRDPAEGQGPEAEGRRRPGEDPAQPAHLPHVRHPPEGVHHGP